MALIVEDGTGRADAESYISVAAFKVYADVHGLSYAGKSDTQIEQALRRATAWMDATYAGRFGGYRITEAQALAWPMSGLVDRGGYSIACDAIPRQWASATAEAAVRELASPGSLSPDVTPGQIVKREKVEGAVEVEYAVGSADASSQMPAVTIIDGLLASLMPSSAVAYTGRAVRA